MKCKKKEASVGVTGKLYFIRYSEYVYSDSGFPVLSCCFWDSDTVAVSLSLWAHMSYSANYLLEVQDTPRFAYRGMMLVSHVTIL